MDKRLGPVLYAVVCLALVATAAAALQRYAHAEGEAEAYRWQRDQLVEAARTYAAERDSLRAVGDTLGFGVDSVNAVLLASITADEVLADSIIIRVVQVVPPEIAAQILMVDSIHDVQIARALRVHVNDSTTISSLRAQLWEERDNHDELMANAAGQIEVLVKENDAWQRAAQVSWAKRSLSASKWVAGGVVLGHLLWPS